MDASAALSIAGVVSVIDVNGTAQNDSDRMRVDLSIQLFFAININRCAEQNDWYPRTLSTLPRSDTSVPSLIGRERMYPFVS